eukprot:1397666-Pyramimonas_sp.AAC.1
MERGAAVVPRGVAAARGGRWANLPPPLPYVGRGRRDDGEVLLLLLLLLVLLLLLLLVLVLVVVV